MRRRSAARLRDAGALLAIFSFAAASAIAQPSVTVVRAGTLIDGRSDAPKRDQVIVIRGNRIESVGPAAATAIPAGATVIDLSHSTVLPGLIDSHTHIFLQGEAPEEGGYDVQLLKQGIAFRAARAAVAICDRQRDGLQFHSIYVFADCG